MKDLQLVQQSQTKIKSICEISPDTHCGDQELLVIAGPCAMESLTQMQMVISRLQQVSVHAIRACIYKPRTSPYTFQGLGDAGIALLKQLKRDYGATLVTEVMSAPQLEAVYDWVDVVQIGSRNMQNFELLRAVGSTDKPILLKRGLAATIDELLMAAEYVMRGGNERVILCERGIRSFDHNTRNVLDLGAVVLLKQITHLPIIVDPSHACGRRALVPALAKAAIAAGADGLMIECHPQPDLSASDAEQALSLDDMCLLVREIAPIARAVGRTIKTEPNRALDLVTTNTLVSGLQKLN